ncbi:MAG: YggS family pyridoxal phosphate-dependent enzyme [Nitrospirae bacterium]|nr:YggS family pyridoxal phosphate-dependent enzyme [Nitrospirota bacterium]
MRILQHLAAIQERINSAAAKAGRNPQDIKLVTVTKTIELQEIIKAVKAGVRILGESRVQEAQEKITNYKLQITNSKVQWHLIGSLQKNKAKYAVQLFDLIHTIDSIELAEEVDKQARKNEKTQRILVQIKLSEEEAKHGVLEKDLMDLLDKISNMNNLKLEGLMTIPPLFEDPEFVRPYFMRLREIRDKLSAKGYNLPELSMGMSNDFEVAIEEGATMVRIGTAIFGERG